MVVLSDMTAASYGEYTDRKRGGFEAENRVAYVAVTRARQRLIIVHPTTRRHYDYPVLARLQGQDSTVVQATGDNT